MNSDIVHRLGYVVFIHGSGVRLPVSEENFYFSKSNQLNKLILMLMVAIFMQLSASKNKRCFR